MTSLDSRSLWNFCSHLIAHSTEARWITEFSKWTQTLIGVTWNRIDCWTSHCSDIKRFTISFPHSTWISCLNYTNCSKILVRNLIFKWDSSHGGRWRWEVFSRSQDAVAGALRAWESESIITFGIILFMFMCVITVILYAGNEKSFVKSKAKSSKHFLHNFSLNAIFISTLCGRSRSCSVI